MRWPAVPRLLLVLAWAAACAAQPAAPQQSPPAMTVTTPPPWPACAPAINNPLVVPASFAPGFPQPPGLLLTKALVLHNDPNNYVRLIRPDECETVVEHILERAARTGASIAAAAEFDHELQPHLEAVSVWAH